jgi:hypothetical protein
VFENPALALAQEGTMFLLFPGILISIAAAGNAMLALWVAALGNFVFYFLLIHFGAHLYSKLRSGSD